MTRLTFGSVCSGIEAASVAWHSLGWKAAWLAEIEPFPSAVLAHHYPEVQNLGDMTKIVELLHTFEIDAPDILCGGTPCQAFSVAGLRQSLDDARGNLSLTFCEIANAIDDIRACWKQPPAIVFWENVPGVLSTKDNAFGCFLAGLAGEDAPLEPPGGKWTDAGCVHGPKRTVAWRTLDAQYFGLAQRRKRVFVVASARADFDPISVLFEFDGVRRDTAPSREAREEIAVCPTLRAGGNSTGGDRPPGTDVDTANSLQVVHTLHGEGFDANGLQHTVGTLCADTHPYNGQDAYTGRLVPVTAFPANLSGTQCASTESRDNIVVFDTTQITSPANFSSPKPGDPCHPLASGAHAPAIAFPANLSGTQCASAEDISPSMGAKNPTAVAMMRESGAGFWMEDTIAGTLDANMGGSGHANRPAVIKQHAMQVRRLTPVECERLQGFPDGYTAIPWRGKTADQCPDGPRYKALGNSWAVPVVRWIGSRIQEALQ